MVALRKTLARLRAPVVLGLGGLVALLPAPARARPAAGFSDDPYARLLSQRVDDRGLVDYRGIASDPADLDAVVEKLRRTDPQDLARSSEADRIAFWINAYNALTLRAIVEHYPIRPSALRSLLYPKNSIRQIPGVWDRLAFEVAGRKLTLDDIEHRILRKEFREPRIHMALVCAARGCPPLRREPYAGARLDEQLEDQTRRFLASPEKFRVDPSSRTVYLSPIFKWFGEDFLAAYGPGPDRGGGSEADRAVLSFVAKRLPADQKRKLEEGRWTISYLDYDWSLNERP
jgi:hypothetical protein